MEYCAATNRNETQISATSVLRICIHLLLTFSPETQTFHSMKEVRHKITFVKCSKNSMERNEISSCPRQAV